MGKSNSSLESFTVFNSSSQSPPRLFSLSTPRTFTFWSSLAPLLLLDILELTLVIVVDDNNGDIWFPTRDNSGRVSEGEVSSLNDLYKSGLYGFPSRLRILCITCLGTWSNLAYFERHIRIVIDSLLSSALAWSNIFFNSNASQTCTPSTDNIAHPFLHASFPPRERESSLF